MKLRLATLLMVLLLCLWSAAAAPPPPAVTFALIGDFPYSPREEQECLNLLGDLNREPLSFVIHNGDIKSGSSPCSDAMFKQRKALFNRSRAPFILMVGDNDWTDCHREKCGGMDSLERLAYVRRLFYPDAFTMGQRRFKMVRQAGYPEHARWNMAGVTFVMLNIVGSNNNKGRTPENDAEADARTRAALEFMRDSFLQAAQQRGIVITIHANPFFEKPRDHKDRIEYNAFLDALRDETRKLKRPVVLVHGDTHYFRIDKPLLDEQGRQLDNFTRVETFGSPMVHWIRGTIDAHSKDVFRFEPVLVRKNIHL